MHHPVAAQPAGHEVVGVLDRGPHERILVEGVHFIEAGPRADEFDLLEALHSAPERRPDDLIEE